MSKHKISTIVLVVLLLIGFALAEFDTSDMNELCEGTNSIIFNNGSEWICSTNTPLTDDLRFPIETIGVRGASNKPTFETYRNGVQALAFDKSTIEQAYISLQTPHGRLENSNLLFHFHWSPTDNTTGNVSWCIEYTCANINTNFSETNVQCILDQSVNQYNHQITSHITVTNNLVFSGMCLARIFRNASQSQDNYDADAHLLEVDAHIQVINIGEVY